MAEVGFHMISDDLEDTMSKLNEVRAKRPKFVCINDDMDDPSPMLLENLQKFYKSFFPHASRFELPPGQTNPMSLQFSELKPQVLVGKFGFNFGLRRADNVCTYRCFYRSRLKATGTPPQPGQHWPRSCS